MISTQYHWYDRSGVPIAETKVSSNGTLILHFNPEEPGDIEITEPQYDILVAQVEADIESDKAALAVASEAIKQPIRSKFSSGTPLTSNEASIVLP